MNKIKAIVFDMDGVLFDTERMFLDAWKVVGGEDGISGIDEAARRCIGLSTTDTEQLLRSVYGDDFPIEEYHSRINAIVRKRIAENGLPVKKGAYEILEYLSGIGATVGLASSTAHKKVREHLERAGMLKYFSVIIGGDMIGHSKPDPEIYLTACRELGCEPSEAAAIEDSRNGIISAYRAGLIPLMVPDLIEPTEELLSMAAGKFDDLLEVMRFLQQIGI